ncbi:hypothetical protein GCM10027160_09070 [Streptomyces calidiresistens]
MLRIIRGGTGPLVPRRYDVTVLPAGRNAGGSEQRRCHEAGAGLQEPGHGAQPHPMAGGRVRRRDGESFPHTSCAGWRPATHTRATDHGVLHGRPPGLVSPVSVVEQAAGPAPGEGGEHTGITVEPMDVAFP